MPYCFWMITRIKNVNNFQIAKVQPQVIFSICVIFAYFSLALLTKKACLSLSSK